jgi:hypothetical protein
MHALARVTDTFFIKNRTSQEDVVANSGLWPPGVQTIQVLILDTHQQIVSCASSYIYVRAPSLLTTFDCLPFIESLREQTSGNESCVTALDGSFDQPAITVCPTHNAETCEAVLSLDPLPAENMPIQNHSAHLAPGFSPEFDSPRVCLKRFTEIYPSNMEAQYELARLLEAYGALTEARKEYAKVIRFVFAHAYCLGARLGGFVT